MKDKQEIKIAVIDMNKGRPNQGLRGIIDILSRYSAAHALDLSPEVFDLRAKNELPGTDYDIYISSGGPGSPYDGEDQPWENSFFELLDHIEDHNANHNRKKYVFLICHSFQLACRKYNLGIVTMRSSTAFGIFPMSLTGEGEKDIIYDGVPNPFYAVDSRDWQVIDAADKNFHLSGAEVLAIEKERPDIDMERCIMSIRFTKEIVGTQFHPEADPSGMQLYLLEDGKKEAIIATHGEEKYNNMLHDLENPHKILLTQHLVLPNFLNEAIGVIKRS